MCDNTALAALDEVIEIPDFDAAVSAAAVDEIHVRLQAPHAALVTPGSAARQTRKCYKISHSLRNLKQNETVIYKLSKSACAAA